jgi:regulator of protease activity HflC (stomatin/prohibitin superfamily)
MPLLPNNFFAAIVAGILFSRCCEAFFTFIPEGHVGVYQVQGQIQNGIITQSAFYIPVYSAITLVKYIQDTDHVENTKCVSNEGVDVIIPDIEIANRIDKNTIIPTIRQYGFDYDKRLVVNPLAQYMRELCAERTVDEIEITDFHKLDDLLRQEIQRQNDAVSSGIIIDYVRVAGVSVPKQIKDKRLKLAEEKANKILAEETMKRTEIEKAAQSLIAKRDDEIRLETANRNNEIMLRNAEAERQRRSIENEIALDLARTSAEKVRLEAAANAEKMSLESKVLQELYAIPEYANVEKMKAIADNTKMIYWGDKLPTMSVGFVGDPTRSSPASSINSAFKEVLSSGSGNLDFETCEPNASNSECAKSDL